MNFHGLDQQLEQYHEATVHPGFPIVSILNGSDNLYVTSEKKVTLYQDWDTCLNSLSHRLKLPKWIEVLKER